MEFVICKLLVKLQNRAVKSIKSQWDIEEAKDLMFNITFHSFENCMSILWLMFEVQLRCILSLNILMVRCATTVEDTSQWVHYYAKVIIWCIVMAHGETSYSCGALMLWVTVWDTVNVHNCKYKCKWWVTQGTVWDPNCVIIGWDHLLCQDGQDSLHRWCRQFRIQNTKKITVESDQFLQCFIWQKWWL